MDKKKLIKLIAEQLERDLAAARAAALATYEAATHEESKPENEYDTRGLEASYLAGAQSKRVAEIEELVYIYKDLQVRDFAADEAISSTALVEVELKGRRSFVFIMSKGGGLIMSIDGVAVQIVTPISPLGEALLGLKVGDTAIVENGDKVREYYILSIQ
jgi:transcription elongation GreA/GreB family factor